MSKIACRLAIAVVRPICPDFPGIFVTPDFLKREKHKQLLMDFLQNLSVRESQWSDDQPEKITLETSFAAISFLNQLPREIEFPKISPDGEGSLVLVWETGISSLLLTIEDRHIHMLRGATTPQAEYDDSLPFSDEIPQEVLRALWNLPNGNACSAAAASISPT